MTLSIDVSYTDPETGENRYYNLGAAATGGDLMGFESFRHEYPGSPVMEQLGLRLLPMLKFRDLLVGGDELDALEREALTIQQNAEFVMEHINPDPIFLWHRTNNILRAVKIARELNGKVSIG